MLRLTSPREVYPKRLLISQDWQLLLPLKNQPQYPCEFDLQCRPEKQSRIYGLASISRRCREVLYDALWLKGVSFAQTRLTRFFGDFRISAAAWLG